MKNSLCIYRVWHYNLLVMKYAALVYVVLCCLCSFAVASDSFGQKVLNNNVTITLTDVPIADALEAIADDAGVRFAYTRNALNSSARITIDVENEKLRDVLKEIFADYKLRYSVIDDIIVLKTSGDEPDAHDKRASDQTISGKVTDEEGQPLPGVNVIEKGTTNGAATDADGNYSLSVADAQSVLVFSFIGYQTKEVLVASNTIINISLTPDTKTLQEVVIVGYGTQEKVNLTGAVSVVQGEDLINRQVASTSVALQGLMPGVMVSQQSGLPGSDGATIRIRGISSMFAGQNPLVLVDNVEMSLNQVDPNNIQSISVLKDAAAASIYGSRAANGVILITTKRGSEKKGTTVQYNGYAGVQEATNLPTKVSALDHMKLYDIGLQNVGRAPVFVDDIADYEQNGPDNFSRFNTDWQDLMLSNDGLIRNHNLSVSTGSDKVSLFASGSSLKQNGLTANTSYERLDFRFNTDVQILRNLTASMDLALNRAERRWPYTSPNTLMLWMIGLPAYLGGQFDSGEYGEGWNNFNPLAMAQDAGFDDNVRKSSILTGTLKYSPFENFEWLASYSSNNARGVSRAMAKQYQVFLPDVANGVLTPGSMYPAVNGLDEQWGETTQTLFRTQFTYERDFNGHELKLLGGFSAEEYQSVTIGASRQNFINEDMPYLNLGDAGTMTNAGGIAEWSMMSFYSRLNYSYKDKYLFELNGRRDGSSRFAAENRWGFFPSVSAGWRVSEEGFWAGSLENIMNEFKVRASYGVLGNQNLSSFYPTVSQYVAGESLNYFFDNAIVSGYALTEANNPGIQWESSKQFDVGLDIAFLNNRLTLTADYFERDIYNMLQRLPIPLLVGLTAPYVNAGSMKNTGWEMSLGWRDQQNKLKYGAQFNLAHVRNEVVDLQDQEYISGRTIIREGYPISSYFGYQALGLFQSQAEIDAAPTHYPTTRPGDIRYNDVSGPDGSPDGIIDNYDRVILGNDFPKFEYSLNMDAAWNGFDIALLWQGVSGRENYLSGNGAWAFHATNFVGTAYDFHKDYWTPENADAGYPRLTVGLKDNYHNSNFWIKDGDYLRLKNVVIGYTLPASLTERLKIGSLRIYASGQNLLTFDNFYPGFDPERDDNTGQFYPIMKTYSVGVNLKIK